MTMLLSSLTAVKPAAVLRTWASSTAAANHNLDLKVQFSTTAGGIDASKDQGRNVKNVFAITGDDVAVPKHFA
jgi:hypothetical protein